MESYPKRKDRKHHESSIYPHGTTTSPIKPENRLLGDDEYAGRLRQLASLPKIRINIQGLSGVIFALTVPTPMELSILHGVISLTAAIPDELFDMHCEGRILRTGIHKLQPETTLRIVLKNPNQFTPFNKIATLDIKTRIQGDFLIDLERPYDSLVADIKAQIQGLINRPANQFQLYFGNKPIETGFYLWCYGIWDKAPVVLEVSSCQLSRSARDEALLDLVKGLTRPVDPLAILPLPTANDDASISEAPSDNLYDELYDEEPEGSQETTESKKRQSLVHVAHRQQSEQEVQKPGLHGTPSPSSVENVSQMRHANQSESQTSSAQGKSPHKPQSSSNEGSRAGVGGSPVSQMTAESQSMRVQEPDHILSESTSLQPRVQSLRLDPAPAPDTFNDDPYSDDSGSASRTHFLPALGQDIQNTESDFAARVSESTVRQQAFYELPLLNRTLGERRQSYEQFEEATAILRKEEEETRVKLLTADMIHSWAKSICYAESTNLALISGIVGLDHVAGATRRSYKIICKPATVMLGTAEIILANVRSGMETVKSIQFGLQELIPLPDFKAAWFSDGKRTTAGRYGTNDIIRFDVQDLDTSATRMCAVLVEAGLSRARVGWVTLYITKLPLPRPLTPPPVAKKQQQRKDVATVETASQPMHTDSHLASANTTSIPSDRAWSEKIYVASPSRPPPRLDVAPRAKAITVTQKKRSKISNFAKSLMRAKKKE